METQAPGWCCPHPLDRLDLAESRLMGRRIIRFMPAWSRVHRLINSMEYEDIGELVPHHVVRFSHDQLLL
jgi:hypothetical protein